MHIDYKNDLFSISIIMIKNVYHNYTNCKGLLCNKLTVLYGRGSVPTYQ